MHPGYLQLGRTGKRLISVTGDGTGVMPGRLLMTPPTAVCCCKAPDFYGVFSGNALFAAARHRKTTRVYWPRCDTLTWIEESIKNYYDLHDIRAPLVWYDADFMTPAGIMAYYNANGGTWPTYPVGHPMNPTGTPRGNAVCWWFPSDMPFPMYKYPGGISGHLNLGVFVPRFYKYEPSPGGFWHLRDTRPCCETYYAHDDDSPITGPIWNPVRTATQQSYCDDYPVDCCCYPYGMPDPGTWTNEDHWGNSYALTADFDKDGHIESIVASAIGTATLVVPGAINTEDDLYAAFHDATAGMSTAGSAADVHWLEDWGPGSADIARIDLTIQTAHDDMSVKVYTWGYDYVVFDYGPYVDSGTTAEVVWHDADLTVQAIPDPAASNPRPTPLPGCDPDHWCWNPALGPPDTIEHCDGVFHYVEGGQVPDPYGTWTDGYPFMDVDQLYFRVYEWE